MKRVLVISTVGLIYDGITSVITSYLKVMNFSQLDIRIVGTIKIELPIRTEIENLGYKIIELPDRRNYTLKYFIALTKYIKREKIEIVHAHGNSGTLAIELLAAWIGGAKKRIAHSHNTHCDQVKADKILRPLFNILYTDALACGEEAGKWLFGKKTFKVITNGRDVNKYKYDSAIRKRMRKQYGLTNEIIIGHIGGFFKQKNHVFLIEIFRNVLDIQSNAKLFLIGDGPLKKEIQKSVEDIKDSVLFIGTTDHVENYLQIMDAMLLPSLFEGLPLVVIECQINGLPCFLSNKITKDCKLTDSVTFLSLENSPEMWSERLVQEVKKIDRSSMANVAIEKIKNSRFDIQTNADTLVKIYEGE